jgi:hypothetical protein
MFAACGNSEALVEADELRALQAPLKEKYKADAGAALVTLIARGDLSGEGVVCGTLGIAKDAPVGFADIRLFYELDTDETQERIESLTKLTERYCVIFQTLAHPPKIALTVTTEASS